MGYRSQVRVITSKKGYDELSQYVTQAAREFETPDYDYNLIKIADAIKSNDDQSQVMLCWDSVKWYEGYYKDVDIIMGGLKMLKDKGYSYTFSRIGEDYDDIEEIHNEGTIENEVDWAWIDRYFDDGGLGFYEDSLLQGDLEDEEDE